MQIVDQLYVNSTNRFPLIPVPCNPNQSTRSPATIKQQSNQMQQINPFSKIQKILEQQIEQAKQQYQTMLDLFTSLQKVEKGEAKASKKLQRRCMKDILDKFYCQAENCNKYYSSLPSLQRHVKIKHSSHKNEPPLLYYDLHPEPNLTETVTLTNEELSGSNLHDQIDQGSEQQHE